MSKHISNVIALTIVDASSPQQLSISEKSRILLAVRSPLSNTQHSDVLSVPTQRVHESLFQKVLGDIELDNSRIGFTDSLAFKLENNDGHSGQLLLVDIVEAILARKLGLADALEMNYIKFSAVQKIFKTGFSPILTDQDTGEFLRMLNILVYFKSDPNTIPKQTASYSHIEWIKIGDFINHIQNCTPLKIEKENFRYPYISGGLCICTADLLVRELLATASISLSL